MSSASGVSFWMALTCAAALLLWSASSEDQASSCTDETCKMQTSAKANKLDHQVNAGVAGDETSQDDGGLNGTDAHVGKRGDALTAVCCCRKGSSSGAKFESPIPGPGCRADCNLPGWSFKYSCTCDVGLLCCDCYCDWWHGPVCRQRNVVDYV